MRPFLANVFSQPVKPKGRG